MIRHVFIFARVVRRKCSSYFQRAYFSITEKGLEFGEKVDLGKDVELRSTGAGSLFIGNNVIILDKSYIHSSNAILSIGSNTLIGRGATIVAREFIQIGEGCQIAENVTIRDQDHRFGKGLILVSSGFETAPIRIGRNVWIGAGAVILKGVAIGENAVIAAGAVVTSDVPENTVFGGVPARQISSH